MENSTKQEGSSNAALWLENCVNGLAGITIRAKHALYFGSSPFQKIEIFQTYAFGKVLVLADNIVLAEKDEFIYHESIIHPAMMMHKNPRHICIIGGGDGGCVRELLKYKEVRSIQVVEIDKMVKEAVTSHYPSLAAGFNDRRVKVSFADGCPFLQKTKRTYDVIVVDSYDPGGPVQSLETARFFTLVHARLNKTGIAVFQTDSPTIRSNFLRNTVANVSGLFAAHRPFLCTVPSFPESICSFVVAAKEASVLDNFNKKRYESIGGQCNYYNPDIHSGMFLLPEYIRRIVA